MKLNLKEWMAKVSAWIAGADGRYVNTTGDTMTGNLTVSASNDADRYVRAINSKASVLLDSASSGNHGVWSGTHSKWLVYGDTSGNVSVNGTPISTSAKNTCNAFINALETASATPVDADYYVSQYVGGGTTNTLYYRRPMSALWAYIKSKAEAVTKNTYSQNSVSLVARRVGKVVSIQFNSTAKSYAVGWTDVCTLATTYRPSTEVNFMAYQNSAGSQATTPVLVRITTGGVVRFYFYTAVSATPYGSATYIVD